MHRPERMGTEPVLKLIIGFALPSVTGMLANALYNIVDRIFVGRVVGSEGLAAISVCFPFMLFVFSLCLLFGVGAAPLIAMALGKHDSPRAERVLFNATLAVFVTASLVGLGSSFFMDTILRLSGASEALLPLAREYLRIILWGVPFSMLAFTLNFCIRAEGRPAYAMGTQILGALANIVLDAILIVGMNMGVAGAAWGTILSQGIAAIWVFSFYWRRLGVLRFHAASCKFDFNILKKNMMLGLSPFLTELSFTIFFMMFNSALQRHGGDIAVSALGAFMGWDSLLFLPVIGIAEAVQTLFAYNYGAKLMQRVGEALKGALIMAESYFALSCLAVYFGAEWMVKSFSTDAELIAIAAPGARISYAGVFFVGIALIANSFFQGLGRAKISLILSLCRQLVFLIPPILILPELFGVVGVWYCFPTVDIGGGILALWLLLREYKRLGLHLLEK